LKISSKKRYCEDERPLEDDLIYETGNCTKNESQIFRTPLSLTPEQSNRNEEQPPFVVDEGFSTLRCKREESESADSYISFMKLKTCQLITSNERLTEEVKDPKRPEKTEESESELRSDLSEDEESLFQRESSADQSQKFDRSTNSDAFSALLR
jgi:hypothetical protein